jgi:nicotinamidase-related amidase
MSNQSDTALLVIDVQQGLFRKNHPIHQSGQLLDNIIDLVEKAHAAGVPVLYVQHEGPNDLVRGSEGWQLHPRLHPEERDFHLLKQKSNCFEGTDLDDMLKEMGVSRLVITGLVTHGCVKNACLGAQELGYSVILVEDAHSNFSAKAAELITEWNEKLRLEGIALKPAAKITFS